MASDKLFHGVIPALVTPFKEDGALDLDAVAAIVEAQIGDGVNGFYVAGNTGEGYAMNAAERRALTEAVIAAVRKRVPVLVHVGAAKGGTAESVELAKHAKEAGADGTSSVVPPEKPRDLAAAVEHFKAVGAACDLPFYVYWVQSNAAPVTPEEFLAGMSEVPNFAGFKFTDTNFYVFQRLVHLGEGKLNCITGPDEMNLAGKVMGSDGAIGSTYNVQPKLYLRMHAAFLAGDIAEAMKLQDHVNVVIALLIDRCNCREKGLNIVAGCKAIMRARGLPAGYPRPETCATMSATAEAELVAALEALPFKVE